jgi:hypothetical protein
MVRHPAQADFAVESRLPAVLTRSQCGAQTDRDAAPQAATNACPHFLMVGFKNR